MLIATILAAIVAILLATLLATLFAAALPNRVGEDLDVLDRRRGVVAFDHKLARTRALFISTILDDDRKARAGS